MSAQKKKRLTVKKVNHKFSLVLPQKCGLSVNVTEFLELTSNDFGRHPAELHSFSTYDAVSCIVLQKSYDFFAGEG